VTKQVLFVQGGGEDVHDRWDDKLVASLARELGEGYAVRYPRMPDEADPQYSAWSGALLDEIGKLPAGSILVGHSVGATILLQLLARHTTQQELGGIFLLAAPFLGEGGWPSDDLEPIVDLTRLLPADVPVYLYHGDADETVPVNHLRLYARSIPQAVVRTLAHRDHQFGNDLSEVAQDIRSLD